MQIGDPVRVINYSSNFYLKEGIVAGITQLSNYPVYVSFEDGGCIFKKSELEVIEKGEYATANRGYKQQIFGEFSKD